MLILKRIVILPFYLELLDDDKTSTILTTSTLQSSTNSWQPGQMKNCTDPGKFYITLFLIKYQLIFLFFFIEAIDEFPEDLFTQSQRRHVRKLLLLFHQFSNKLFKGSYNIPFMCLYLYFHCYCYCC
jgi:hypothetical protein